MYKTNEFPKNELYGFFFDFSFRVAVVCRNTSTNHSFQLFICISRRKFLSKMADFNQSLLQLSGGRELLTVAKTEVKKLFSLKLCDSF